MPADVAISRANIMTGAIAGRARCASMRKRRSIGIGATTTGSASERNSSSEFAPEAEMIRPPLRSDRLRISRCSSAFMSSLRCAAVRFRDGEVACRRDFDLPWGRPESLQI